MSNWEMQPKVSATEAAQILEKAEAAQNAGKLPKAQMPHKYTRFARGIPMINADAPDVEMPAMNVPYEGQWSIGVHLERCGLVHVDELKAMADENGKIDISDLPPVMYVHIKPKHGPDIPMNPGTWEVPSAENAADQTVVEPVEIPASEIVGAPKEKLVAMEQAIQEEKIRQLKIKQADLVAFDEGGIGS